MTLILQRILFSVTILIWLVSGETIQNPTTKPPRAQRDPAALPFTPSKSTATTTLVIRPETPTQSTSKLPAVLGGTPPGSATTSIKAPERLKETPTTGTTPAHLNQTPSGSTPAKLNQTPSPGKQEDTTTHSLRPTPTSQQAVASTSAASLRPTPTPAKVESSAATTTGSLRPTPTTRSGSTSTSVVSRRETPSSTTPLPIQNSPTTPAPTPFPTSPIASTTPVMTQPVVVTTASPTPLVTQPMPSTTPVPTSPMPTTPSPTVSMTSPMTSSTPGPPSPMPTTGAPSSTLTPTNMSSSAESTTTAGVPSTTTSAATTTTQQPNTTLSTTPTTTMTQTNASTAASTTTSMETTTTPTTTISSTTTASTTMSSTSTPSTTTPSTTSTSGSTMPNTTVTTTSSTSTSTMIPTTSTPTTTMTPTPTTTTPSTKMPEPSTLTSTMAISTTMMGQGGGPITHVQIMFCNPYYSLSVPSDPAYLSPYLIHMKQQIAKTVPTDVERLQGMTIVTDQATGRLVAQFDVFPGPGLSTTEVVQILATKVASKSLAIQDKNNNMLYVNCDIPINPTCIWTDYGPCQYQRCMNGGICRCAFTGRYYCECPPGYSGQYCELNAPAASTGSNNNLLWLLIIPAAIAALLLLLCCLFCWRRMCFCCGPPPPQKVEIIEEDVYHDVDNDNQSVRSIRSVRSQPPIYTVAPPMMMNDPGSTYYHALGRPFAVAFNDNTFSAVGYATADQGIYNATGKKSLCGDEEIQVILNGGGSCRGSVYSDAGSAYHNGMGNKYAVAYNGRTFNTYSSMPHYDRSRHYN